MKVTDIDLDQIDQNENSRVIYKQADLSELMGSLKRDGLLQPVGVKKSGDRFEAVYGNRRIMAAKKLGWARIPAIILNIESENDRDILNLIENMKRTNTTLAEDGRMFCMLIDRGLGMKEIAARLEVSLVRVETAVTAFKEIPSEYHGVITNTSKRTPGTINAGTAHQILTLRKNFNLTRGQTRTLLNSAKAGEVDASRARTIAPMMKAGMQLKVALERAENLQLVSIQFFVDRKLAEKFKKKTGKTVNAFLTTYLESNKEIDILRLDRAGWDQGKGHVKARSAAAAHAPA